MWNFQGGLSEGTRSVLRLDDLLTDGLDIKRPELTKNVASLTSPLPE